MVDGPLYYFSLVSRARVTQIMNLNLLPPGMQEELFFCPASPAVVPVFICGIAPRAVRSNWQRQFKQWHIQTANH
jgi:hypothetical protein